jgi:uncharacterized protein YcfL
MEEHGRRERRKSMRVKVWMALLLCALVLVCCSCKSNESASTAEDESMPILESEASAVATSEPATTSAAEEKPAAPKPAAAPRAPAGVRYSRYNLHYYSQRNVSKASYTNWTECPGHAFLPYNTAFKVGYWRQGFTLTAVDTGMSIYFEYASAKMGGMSAREYLDMIMSDTPVSYPNLSEVDQEGIRMGKATLGMSKEGVMIALGYPDKSRTPSTDLDTWVYSKGRFNMLTVTFSQDGKVGSMR